METGDRLVLNAASVRADYQRDFMRHRQALGPMAASRGVAFMSATTREPYSAFSTNWQADLFLSRFPFPMNLFFSNPLFWLMAAAAVPLLVHLFARSRPREREFRSLIFLRRAVKRHVRLRRPKDWGCFFWLSGHWRRLVWRRRSCFPTWPGGASEEQGSRSVILVVDRSAPVSAADGQESRISKAGVFAGQIMSDLKRGDLVNLIWADAAPAALRDPMPSHDLVNRELQRIHSRPEAANTAAALALAVEQAARTASTRPTSVYILPISSRPTGAEWTGEGFSSGPGRAVHSGGGP